MGSTSAVKPIHLSCDELCEFRLSELGLSSGAGDEADNGFLHAEASASLGVLIKHFFRSVVEFSRMAVQIIKCASLQI